MVSGAHQSQAAKGPQGVLLGAVGQALHKVPPLLLDGQQVMPQSFYGPF